MERERDAYQKQAAQLPNRCLSVTGGRSACVFTSFLFLFERITVVDPKAVCQSAHEARVVLIEADEKQAIVMRIGFQIHCLDAYRSRSREKKVAFLSSMCLR